LKRAGRNSVPRCLKSTRPSGREGEGNGISTNQSTQNPRLSLASLLSREHDATDERPEAVAVHEWLLEMTRRHHGPDEHTGAALMTMAQVGGQNFAARRIRLRCQLRG
jgi:hypothetical protein